MTILKLSFPNRMNCDKVGLGISNRVDELEVENPVAVLVISVSGPYNSAFVVWFLPIVGFYPIFRYN